jgi:hypothetical protein
MVKRMKVTNKGQKKSRKTNKRMKVTKRVKQVREKDTKGRIIANTLVYTLWTITKYILIAAYSVSIAILGALYRVAIKAEVSNTKRVENINNKLR